MEYRKVKFKNYINKQWTEEMEGVFHQWGYAYEEFESGPGNYTVAIVEDNEGRIHEILPSKIIFIDPAQKR